MAGITQRPAMVVGNWKMHGSRDSVADLLDGIANGLAKSPVGAEVVVCPPAVYLQQVATALGGTAVKWGAQTLSEHPQGAYTGEIAADMLADFGCRYVIVGHSERRSLFAESDQQIAAKMQAALAAELAPILCIGESLEQREAGEALAQISRQIKAVVDVLGVAALAQSVIAYEPIWAIGTGKTASPEQAQEVHAHIRAVVASYDEAVAADLAILYGGSVKADNAEQLFAQKDIDGALVGGASLKASDFIAIASAA